MYFILAGGISLVKLQINSIQVDNNNHLCSLSLSLSLSLVFISIENVKDFGKHDTWSSGLYSLLDMQLTPDV